MTIELTLLTIPPDVLYGILCHLPIKSLSTIFRTCKRLNNAASSEEFWYRYVVSHYPPIILPAPHKPLYWKPPGTSWVWFVKSKKDLGYKANHKGLGCKQKPYYLHSYYQGEWVDGIRTGGWGIAFLENGDRKDIYFGQFNVNKRHGKGTYYCSNGDIYDGDFEEDQHQGHGKYNWANGNSYEGEYKAFKRDGKGKFTERSGHVIEGHWKDGFPVEEGKNVDLKYVVSTLHPKVKDALQRKVCTFSVTGEEKFAQPFYELKQLDERTHGVCLSCYENCLPKNSGVKLIDEKPQFGGNFYCDCGAEVEAALKCVCAK